MNKLKIAIEVLPHCKAEGVPKYATPGSAGLDLVAAIDKNIELAPLARILIPNGIKLMLPKGYEAQIRPRSGLALKNGITVLNSPGTIDSDYRGEINSLLINLSDKPFIIERGARISQMVIMQVVQAELTEHDSLPDDTKRGEQGFGSTGS